MPGRPKSNETKRHILAQLAKNPTLSEEQIASAIGVSRNTVAVHLRDLMHDDVLLPKGYYLKPKAKPKRKILKYIFIRYSPTEGQWRDVVRILEANAERFPYVRVTSPFDYIAFVPTDASGRDTDAFITQLLEAGAVPQTSVLTGDPPESSPELPDPADPAANEVN